MAHGVYEIWYRSARNYWGVIYLGERDIGPRCSSKRLLSHSWTLYHRRWRLINDLTTSWWTMWNLFEGVYHVSIPTARPDNTALIYGYRPFFVAGKFAAAITLRIIIGKGRFTAYLLFKCNHISESCAHFTICTTIFYNLPPSTNKGLELFHLYITFALMVLCSVVIS